MNVKELREQLKAAAKEVQRLQAEVVEGERACKHSYSAPEYDPLCDPLIKYERWRRDCILCGRIEYTADTKPGPAIPVFPRSCPCWATGVYVWVPGCEGHPRESMT